MSQVHFYQLASWVFLSNPAQSLVVFVRIRSRCFHLTLPPNMRMIGLEDTSRLRYTNPPNTKQPSAIGDRKMPSLGIHIFSVQTLSCKAFRPGKDSCRVKFADMSWERVQPTQFLCAFFCYIPLLWRETLPRHLRVWGDFFYTIQSWVQVPPRVGIPGDSKQNLQLRRREEMTGTSVFFAHFNFGKSISIVLHMRLVCSFVHFFSESLEEFNESQNFGMLEK